MILSTVCFPAEKHQQRPLRFISKHNWRFANGVCTLSPAACLQLAETEQEAQAECERRQAAEQALEAERRAAEYARSRPTSPFQDPGLQSELASLRQQVCCTQTGYDSSS